MSSQEFHFTVESDGERTIDVLAARSALPKQRLKDALNKGAVWLRQGSREQRLRRATKTLRRGDQLSLYYDAEILQRQAPLPRLIKDETLYSVWHKPAGMLAQGTHFGDHCALLRFSEQAFTPQREAFLVHRLDREAQGLMVIAHTKAATQALSQLWQQRELIKRYEIIVEGYLGDVGTQRRIETPLDDKPSITEIEVAGYIEQSDRTALEVTLVTGRKHQIRRHLAAIGHSVVGDYRYGKGGEPLALCAVELHFRCPLTGIERNYSTEPSAS